MDSGYALSAFFLALPACIVVTVLLLSVGLGLAVLIGGLVLVSMAVMVARGFARVERSRLRSMLGREAATPPYLHDPIPSGAAP